MARDNLQDALRLAQNGYKVMPLHTAVDGVCDCARPRCPSPAKHPWLTDWVREASDQLETVLGWWRDRPGANVGVACGPSGAVVIDIDPRHGGEDTVEAWVQEHGAMPDGPRVITGGGGLHLYFAHPGGRVLSRTVAPGIDCKADGGQVVAPPSVHASGMTYRWVDGYGPERALPVLPDWLLAIVQSGRETLAEDGPKVLPEKIEEGTRRQWLLSWAGALRSKGASREVLFASMMALNAERCAPPLERGEIAELAADVEQRYAPSETFVYTSRPEPRGRERYVPRPFTAADLQLEEMPDIRWAVPGLLPEGLALLAGRPKLGKSWMTLNVACAVAEGDVAMGELPCDDGDALVLALEDNKRRLQSRLRRMLGKDGRWPDRMHMEVRWPRQDEGGIEALDAWLGQHPDARLVVIDVYARFKAREQKGKRGDVYAEDYAAGERLQELALAHHVAIWVVTHYNKSLHEDWINAVTSSSGTTGVADTICGLERPRGARGQQDAVLHVTGRDVDENDWAVAFEGVLGRWTILGDAEEHKAASRDRALTEAIAKFSRPVNAEDMAAALDKTRPAAARQLQRAAADGTIEALGNGFYRNRVVAEGYVAMSLSSHPAHDTTTNDTSDATTQTTPATANGHLSFDLGESENARSTYYPNWLVGKACPTCGSAKGWTQRVGGVWKCSVCAPAVVPLRREEGA